MTHAIALALTLLTLSSLTALALAVDAQKTALAAQTRCAALESALTERFQDTEQPLVLGPYRTAAAPALLIEETGAPKATPLVLDFSSPYSPRCPRCGDSWTWAAKDSPDYCECAAVDVGHFHQSCPSSGGKAGCNAKWIVRAAKT